jgi:hypothetical protein
MRDSVRYAALAAWLFSLSACGSDVHQVADAAAIDGGAIADAATADAAPPDASTPDASTPDAFVSGPCEVALDGGSECVTGMHCAGGACVADVGVSANASRFYDVDITAPAEFIPLAGAAFHDAFVSGDSLVFVGTDRSDPGELRLFGGIGTLNADGSYTLDDATSFVAAAHGSSGSVTSEPFTFQMKAFGAQQPIVLVDTVITDGAIDAPEGITLLESGKLAGVLTPDNARAVYIQDANLDLFDLINSLEIAPDVDHDSDGTRESWTWSLTFSTVPVWLF